jgi:S-adenosylmethionine hydrolase
MTDPIITLTTDFGRRDPYVATMKGVLLSRCPDARIVDLSHDIAPQDLIGAALFAEAAMPWFPENTLHVLVIDPGVGTVRRAIAARAGGQTFVFPDNGLMTLLFRKISVDEAHIITMCPFIPEEVSRTFHGRDVFAPVAAWLSLGHPLDTLGPPAKDLLELDLPEHKIGAEGAVRGEIIHIDHFGNCVTNIPSSLFDIAGAAHSAVLRNNDRILPLLGTYADVASGHALALPGSAGRIEIAVRDGNAAASLNLHRGDTVRIV